MNIASDRSARDFPLVGIGASAGGLEAVRTFLEVVPGDTGMAFVLVMHLSPERESRLSEVLQTVSRMPVTEVRDPVEIEPDHVYVISPGRALTIEGQHLVPIEVTRLTENGHPQVVIDRFFRALADQWRERSVGIVLSGSGTDGTLGIRAIREANGLTMAQAPAEAQFHAMPVSAIDTGLVDIEAPVDELARRLVSLRSSIGEFELPSQETPPTQSDDTQLEKILARVQAETNHDFTGYKRSTVQRRIARRMQANEVNSLDEYLAYINAHDEETHSLFRDLLISVTNFFRDPDAFQVLAEQVMPTIVEEKGRGDSVRIWVPGCATGEEAYSLSILMAETIQQLDGAPTVQIFGTDVDEDAIVQARRGLYPDSISVDVSPERLDRFFVRENSHYRVRKRIREPVLFARHNLLRDPPFSEIDLISCRNVLIYLQRKQQEPVFEMFHFALRNGGYLFLGPSESAEGTQNLFTVIDKKQSIYRRRPGTTHPIRFSRMLARDSGGLKIPQRPGDEKKSREIDFAEKHRGLIVEQYEPTSILVGEDHTVVDVAKRGSALLEYPQGQPPHVVLDIVSDDVRPSLRTALFQLFKNGEESEKVIRNGSGDDDQLLRVRVRRVAFDDKMAQVLLEEVTDGETPPEQTDRPAETNQLVEQLEEELEDTKEQLQTTIEQYETSTEELRASNEELLSMNEELQSTTEELETGREELQSMNEELSTVNNELERKVEELERANSDLENFISAADIGTIFLDRDFRVRRYTPRVTQVFNLISSDVGRSITHITHNLEYEDLSQDVRGVFDNQSEVEREVSTTDGSWYIMRIRPYRSADENVSGVVLSFFDITRRKEAEEDLRERTEELEEANEKLRDQFEERERLQEEVLSASEEERWRLGESLHNDLGQQLTGIQMLSYSLTQNLKDEDSPYIEEAKELTRQIRKADRQTDALISGIIPVAMDEQGIGGALDEMAANLEQGYDIACDIEMPEDVSIADNTAATRLYRIAQEASHNAVQHGNATEISIQLTKDSDRLVLTITDDGEGFEGPVDELMKEGIGIRLMKYRCELIGGTFSIDSLADNGVQLSCSIPMDVLSEVDTERD